MDVEYDNHNYSGAVTRTIAGGVSAFLILPSRVTLKNMLYRCLLPAVSSSI